MAYPPAKSRPAYVRHWLKRSPLSQKQTTNASRRSSRKFGKIAFPGSLSPVKNLFGPALWENLLDHLAPQERA